MPKTEMDIFTRIEEIKDLKIDLLCVINTSEDKEVINRAKKRLKELMNELERIQS